LPGDPRWSLRAIDLRNLPRDDKGRPITDDLAGWQVDVADEMFWPIAHKNLGLMEGNHEQAMAKYYNTHLVYQLMRRWKERGVTVPYGGQTAFMRLDFAFGHETTTKYIFAEHGATGGGTPGNAVNDFQKRLVNFDADLWFKGHVHRRLIWQNETLAWGQKKITSRTRVMALTGSYLKSYGLDGPPAYAERASYPPVTIGGVVALIKPSTGELEVINSETLNMLGGKI